MNASSVVRSIAAVAWLVSLIAAAHAAEVPKKYINLEKGENGERSTLPVWKTYDDMMACMQKSFRGLMNNENRKAFEGGPCTDGRVANLPHGTVVEPIDPSAECKTLIKIRILSGNDAGKVACAPAEEISPTLVP